MFKMNFRHFFRHTIFRRRWVRATGFILGALAAAWLVMFAAVPRKLFDDPISTLLYSREGELLSARIASDGQWRFPESDSLPEKFVKCLIAYEDKRFRWHPGVDPVAAVRAAVQNARSGGVVSGGSTITMQLARIARGNRNRTLWQKAVETAWALYIETTHSKNRILRLYASNAPFGGNVVGLEAASWRWFGRSPFELSWAESAMLAVLPNSPALIHPGRNRGLLLQKRNRLLHRLARRGVIDALECDLACEEPLPAEPLPLPDFAPHLRGRMSAADCGERPVASVRYALQRQVQAIVNRYGERYAANRIHNVAAIVADIETGETLAYAGNVTGRANPSHGESVDLVVAERSTGSLLKPLLYAAMLDDGLILPGTLIPDTPLNINGFSPDNYDRTFHGAVPAHTAISRSLNVPLVRMLSRYNTGRFMSLLRACGMTTLHFSEEHYGASIILGGAEGTLWDLAGIYASLARTLNHFGPFSGQYDRRDIHPLTVFPAAAPKPVNSSTDSRLSGKYVISAAGIWSAFEAMSALNRPEEEADWQQFSSMKRIAWKTGTSYGARDGWSVGVTPRHVVAVWVGNASGEGRAGLTGVSAAAPVMFDIFSLLPDSGWFETPYYGLTGMAVCRRSGYKASSICDRVDTLPVPKTGVETGVCPFHRLVHLSPDGRYRVNSSCEDVGRMVTRSWFVLPPGQEYFYRSHNSDYTVLPPVKPGCREVSESIEIIYPENGSELFLPRGLTGERESFVFSAVHSDRDAVLFWYLDDGFLCETRGVHRISCSPPEGGHLLTVVDSSGNRRASSFTVRR